MTMRWGLMATLTLVACRGEGESPSAAPPPAEAPRVSVEVMGCVERRAAGDGQAVCEVDPNGTLRLTARTGEVGLFWLVASAGGRELWRERLEGYAAWPAVEVGPLLGGDAEARLEVWVSRAAPPEAGPAGAPTVVFPLRLRGEEGEAHRLVGEARRLLGERAWAEAARVASAAVDAAQASGLLTTELTAWRYQAHALGEAAREAHEKNEPHAGDAALITLLKRYVARSQAIGGTLDQAVALRKAAEGLDNVGEGVEARLAAEAASALNLYHPDAVERLRATTLLAHLAETQGDLDGALRETTRLRALLAERVRGDAAPLASADLRRLAELVDLDLDAATRALDAILQIEAQAIGAGLLGAPAYTALADELYPALVALCTRYETCGDSYRTHHTMILAALAQGHLDQAEAWSRQADPWRSPGDEDRLGRVATATQLALARGRLRQALTLVTEAEAHAPPGKDYHWMVSWLRVQVLEALGRRDEALQLADHTRDEIEAQAVTGGADESQAVFVGSPQVVWLYRWVEAHHRAAGQLALALEDAERGRLLFDVLADARAGLAAGPAAALVAEHHAAMETLHTTLVDDPGAEALQKMELAAGLARQRGARQAVLAKLGDEALKATPTPSTPPRLAPGQVLLELSATPDARLVAYRIDQAGVDARESAVSLRDIGVEATAWADALRRGAPPEALPPALTALASLVAWAAPPGTTHLTVVPYGPTFGVPFALLPVGGRPLVEGVDVSVLPSLKYLPDGAPAAAPAGGAALVVGNPTRDLRSTEDEAREVAARLGGAPLLGEAVTRRAFLDALGGARVVHFAGHAARPAEGRLGAHLLLADHHLVTPWDLSFRPMAASLVTLSACATAEGAPLGPGDVFGLPSAFLSAGAGAVLGTLWPLEQGDALPLLRRFYEEWDGSASGVAGAWARTQRAALGGELTGASPRGFAGFVVWAPPAQVR